MKNLKIKLSLVALSSIALLQTACNNSDKKVTSTTNTVTTEANTQAGKLPFEGRIAHVNIDSFDHHYEYLKGKREAFEKKQKAIEDELIRTEQALQNEANALGKRAQAGTLTQAEGESAQKRLMQQGEALEKKRQNYTQQLMKEQQTFNEELQKELRTFLDEYNSDKGYDYILSYSEGGSILLSNKSLDITQDVIDGMNKKKKSSSSSSTDTTSSK